MLGHFKFFVKWRICNNLQPFLEKFKHGCSQLSPVVKILRHFSDTRAHRERRCEWSKGRPMYVAMTQLRRKREDPVGCVRCKTDICISSIIFWQFSADLCSSHCMCRCCCISSDYNIYVETTIATRILPNPITSVSASSPHPSCLIPGGISKNRLFRIFPGPIIFTVNLSKAVFFASPNLCVVTYIWFWSSNGGTPLLS